MSRLLLGLEREQDQAPADPRRSIPQTPATTPTPRPNDSSLPTASPSPLPDRTTSLPLPLPEQSDPISKTLSGALSLAQSTAERRRSREPKRSILSLRTTPSPQRTSSPSSPINQQGRPVNPTTTTSSPSSILTSRILPTDVVPASRRPPAPPQQPASKPLFSFLSLRRSSAGKATKMAPASRTIDSGAAALQT